MKLRLSAALAALSLTVFAAEPKLAPEAEAVISAAAAFYKSSTSASVEVVVNFTQELPGKLKGVMRFSGKMAVAPPNKFAFHLAESPDGKARFVSDGRTVWEYVEALNQYVTDDAPATLEDLLRDHRRISTMLAQFGPLPDLFRAKPRELLLADVTSLTHAGREKFDGVECHRLHAVQDDRDWVAWFEASDRAVLRKYTFNPMRGMLATADDEKKKLLEGAKFEVTVEFHRWNVNGVLPKDTFIFSVPKDAKKVAEFTTDEALTPMVDETGLVGKPAPDFALDLLAGGKAQLAAHKGKNVVILDFWATWCAPCVRSLPLIAEVAAAYKEQGVVLYAATQEEADVVKKFLAEKKLEIAVPMDAKGEVAKLYKVTGIPQTVIIGKDGNIVAVHIGAGPDVKVQLAKDLDAALAK